MASITRRVEVFTFSTALQRVTGDVRRAAAGETRHLESVPYAWGGGTSIGVCLREFLRTFGERLLGRDTVVIIASDGLDVGEPDTLRGAMSELHRRSAGARLAESASRDAGLRADGARHERRPTLRHHVCQRHRRGVVRAAVASGARAGVTAGRCTLGPRGTTDTFKHVQRYRGADGNKPKRSKTNHLDHLPCPVSRGTPRSLWRRPHGQWHCGVVLDSRLWPLTRCRPSARLVNCPHRRTPRSPIEA